jgi:hypothetical protein
MTLKCCFEPFADIAHMYRVLVTETRESLCEYLLTAIQTAQCSVQLSAAAANTPVPPGALESEAVTECRINSFIAHVIDCSCRAAAQRMNECLARLQRALRFTATEPHHHSAAAHAPSAASESDDSSDGSAKSSADSTHCANGSASKDDGAVGTATTGKPRDSESASPGSPQSSPDQSVRRLSAASSKPTPLTTAIGHVSRSITPTPPTPEPHSTADSSFAVESLSGVFDAAFAFLRQHSSSFPFEEKHAPALADKSKPAATRSAAVHSTGFTAGGALMCRDIFDRCKFIGACADDIDRIRVRTNHCSVCLVLLLLLERWPVLARAQLRLERCT